MTELDLIGWLASRVAADPRVPVGIGDDAAVVDGESGQIVVTVDMLLEGVHFDLDQAPARAVGRKSLLVNLSDLAAMAARPTACVVAVGLPAGRDDAFARELFEGLESVAGDFGVAIAGGDTNRSAGGLVLAVTLIGVPTGKGPVLRSGARPGDVLLVTGRLGYSYLGRHLDFTPRVTEAIWLNEHCEVHAMIDLSDGLGSDLFHLTDSSGCGARVEADAIPVAGPGDARDGRGPVEHALADGEDFEILVALGADEADRLCREQPFGGSGVPLTRIGEMTAEPGVVMVEHGRAEPFDRTGYRHEW